MTTAIPTSNKPTFVFSVEGNIGAGKTTLLKAIEELKDPNIIVHYEPVSEWMNLGKKETGTSIFEMYYNDKKRYGFLFQMYALQTRIKNLEECIRKNPGKIILTERCHMTDSEIFAKMMYKERYMSPIEFQVYQTWYNLATKMTDLQVHGIIYLTLPYNDCIARIATRERPGEDSIELKYLKMLGTTHDEWISNTTLPTLKIENTNGKDNASAIVMWCKEQTMV